MENLTTLEKVWLEVYVANVRATGEQFCTDVVAEDCKKIANKAVDAFKEKFKYLE